MNCQPLLLSITIPGGHLLQANDTSKVGLASLFTDMMNEDTKNYTAEQMSVNCKNWAVRSM